MIPGRTPRGEMAKAATTGDAAAMAAAAVRGVIAINDELIRHSPLDLAPVRKPRLKLRPSPE